jgi:U4/U6 small nuclear ribonucleoprotein PRP4
VWSSRDFTLLKTLAGHEGKIMGADMCPAQQQQGSSHHLIGSVSYDRTIKLWQPEEETGLDLMDVDDQDGEP